MTRLYENLGKLQSGHILDHFSSFLDKNDFSGKSISVIIFVSKFLWLSKILEKTNEQTSRKSEFTLA